MTSNEPHLTRKHRANNKANFQTNTFEDSQDLVWNHVFLAGKSSFYKRILRRKVFSWSFALYMDNWTLGPPSSLSWWTMPKRPSRRSTLTRFTPASSSWGSETTFTWVLLGRDRLNKSVCLCNNLWLWYLII